MKKKPSQVFAEERDELKRKNSYKRSGTMLLRNIKDPDNSNTNVGKVPKDIGFNLIRDLVMDEVEFEETKSVSKRAIQKKKTIAKF